MNIGIYIYENAEVLDFAGPFEVLSTAKRLASNQWNICLIGESKEIISTRGNFLVTPHYDINKHPILDVLIVVGGDHTLELCKSNIITWIHNVSKKSKYTLSVCTGAFLLAEAGLLENKKVTTHWEDISTLRLNYRNMTVIDDKRWIQDGKFLTSAGISAGMDMCLMLVSIIESTALAHQTARQMEYQWQHTN